MEHSVPARSARPWAYLQLLRPANVVTAMADVLAGFAASGAVGYIEDGAIPFDRLGWLLLATVGLYGGGIVFNDVFDAELDAAERPERPIPSGRATRKGAAIFGAVLLLIGVAAAGRVTWLSGLLALAIAACAVLYDAWGKHQTVLGPLNMGMCRGGNLLLGVSAVGGAVGELWFLGAIPVFYITSITAVSRGEVHGGTTRTGVLALSLITLVLLSLVLLDWLPEYRLAGAVPFLLLFGAAVVPAFVRAARQPEPDTIRRAVKSGVLSLIILDATLAAGFAGWLYGLVVLALLPVSIGLARLFAVT